MKNPTEILNQAAGIPAKIEEKLPAGAPKLSTMLTDTAAKLPVVPDLPMEIPDLPVLPELPEMPLPGGGGLKLPFVTSATVRPVQKVREVVLPPPARVAIVPHEIKSRRGI